MGTRCPRTLHTDRLDGQEDGKGLADLVVEPGFADLLDEEDVGLLVDPDLVARDLAEDAYRHAGAWERMPPDEVIGDAEQSTESANLVCARFSVICCRCAKINL
jgi:hypothetical protein